MARETLTFRCFGPLASAVTYGRLTSVCWVEDSFDLGFLGRFLQTLHGQRVALQVDAAFLLELVDEVVDQADVEVFAAEEGVAVGGQHFELVLAVDFGDLDHRHVEGTAAQVIDDHGVVALGLVQAIGQRRRGRLVDDPLDVEAGDAAGVLVAWRWLSLK